MLHMNIFKTLSKMKKTSIIKLCVQIKLVGFRKVVHFELTKNPVIKSKTYIRSYLSSLIDNRSQKGPTNVYPSIPNQVSFW